MTKQWWLGFLQNLILFTNWPVKKSTHTPWSRLEINKSRKNLLFHHSLTHMSSPVSSHDIFTAYCYPSHMTFTWLKVGILFTRPHSLTTQPHHVQCSKSVGCAAQAAQHYCAVRQAKQSTRCSGLRRRANGSSRQSRQTPPQDLPVTWPAGQDPSTRAKARDSPIPRSPVAS